LYTNHLLGMLYPSRGLDQMTFKKACSSNPCQNSGTCINLLDAFFCLCPSNWQGPFCSVDVNECQIYAGTNTPGSYSCRCTPETYGPHCASKFDDCQAGSRALCEHGVCIDGNREQPNTPKYSCICDAGWMSPLGSPACSADVDECSLPSRPCSQNPPVQCVNAPGSYFCGPCPTGWQGNGYSCKDINECDRNNGDFSTVPMVQCINTMGSFYCGPCPPGYEGDGRLCSQVDICSVNNGGCHILASCTSTPATPIPSCVCSPGYTGNGYGPNGCAPLSDICQSQNQNPCENGQCFLSWTGPNCTENINECFSNPCQNGGNCTDEVNGYFCQCTNTWTGPQCQTPQQVCGESLSGLSGSFSYPNNPSSERYDHQVSCAWVIRTTFNKILRITFPFFQLEESNRCNYDFLQIHDGESASAHMIGKYCGSSPPPELFSTHNSLYFWFRSDHTINAGGFTVHWESQEPQCGGELTGTYGSINSPGYPGNYPPNRDCYWIISTNPGLLITFAFGTLSLEHHDNCNNDYLEIRDGLLSQDSILGKYCSSRSPPPLQTTGPYAWIHFHSDAAVSDRGFHITYTTSPADPNCGGNYTDSDGIITSPYWPNPYMNNRQCIYIIRQPPNEKIYLSFTHMELESQSGCSLNYIEVRDGSTEMSPIIYKFCDNMLPSPITSNSNSLWIKFKSDTSVQRASFRAVYKVACGGVLSGEGVIRSPYYPRAYTHEKICEWTISQPEGNVVILNFVDFGIRNISTCNSDYVEVRDGSNADSPYLGRYCGTTTPSAVQTTQNYLYVKFRASSVTNLGFMAEYRPLDTGKPCGEILTRPEGTITSPGHPTTYPHGIRCTWTISVQPGHLIRLTFTSFNLEFAYTCYQDYLEVYDNGTMTKLGRYCGRSIPPSVTSSDNIMTLYFVTNRNIASEGFSVNYVSLNASTVCSREYTEATGVLTSPNYPNNYPNKMECLYRIRVDTNNQIALHFTNFSLEWNRNCWDYVELRDGGYETSPLLGTYCGSVLPTVIISHSNKLWIKFVSDVYGTASGFSAYWDGTSTGCGATLTTPSGIFTSPNYPMPYYHNSECYWLLKSSRGSPYELQFDQFHLEFHERCSYDYLAVYDGNSTNAKMLGEFCGNQIPASIRSTWDSMYVKLRTDISLGGGGFLSNYKQICQGVVIANRSQGILESLNYPNDYPLNKRCNWTIQTTSGNTLNYSFTTFNVQEGEANCNRDYLKLYDGPSAQTNLIGTFCGNSIPPAGSTTGKSLHVVFYSDGIGSASGFQMLWNMNGCGGEFSGASGSFSSPGYPNRYPNNKECIWFIHTTPGSSVQLTILEFDIEYHSSCNYDVLEVYGGPDFLSPRLAQLCVPRPAENPLQVSSTGNTMTVRFKTDASVNKRGFNATWQERQGGCGGVFQATSGEIHSPNYPRSYSDNTDCSWVIQVDSGHRVLLNFTDFDIEPRLSCTFDNVAVYDGPSGAAPLLGKFCGGQRPMPLTSTQNTMFVRFHSDSSIQHRGFNARFTEACGSFIEADSIGAAISSPLYPVNYPNSQNCSWIIQAQEPFNHVTLSFTDFDTDHARRNCTTDYVKILDGDNSDAPLQGRYCGTTLPHPVTSFSNALVLNFVSNKDAAAGRGFRATFSASSSACGGTFHMENGAFNSPGYTESYPLNTECAWNLLSSPGNRLQLSFMTFQIEESDRCTKDYLEIREGNATGELVGRYCGNALPLNYTSVIGHILWVKFVSDDSGRGVGFRALFTHMFGNDIVGSSGQIASPLWPRKYPHNSNYQWKVTVNATRVIRGQILQLAIENHPNCIYDKLKVYDGPNIHYPLMATYCGVERSSFTSSGSFITLQFLSDSSVTATGFLLEWYAVDASSETTSTIARGACGGAATTGETPSFLFSPGWPLNYRNNVDCTWVIRAPGSTVEFNILTLDTETQSSCTYDKLIFRDGDNSLAPVLATICGREIPGPIRSTGEALFIRFVADGSITGSGFNASYHKSCGGYMHANRGVITSPNYPQTYAPNLNCSWHVLVNPGYIIAIHFEQPFQVQSEDASCSHGDYIEVRQSAIKASVWFLGIATLIFFFFSCTFSYLELRDGADASSPLITKLCGNSLPDIQKSSGPVLYMKFRSDNSATHSGFIAKYSKVLCGGTLTGQNGVIESVGYPNIPYQNNLLCEWFIHGPTGHYLTISLEVLDVQNSSGCANDFVEIREDNATGNLLGKYCGATIPDAVDTSDSFAYVKFVTDESISAPGFKLHFAASAQGCGGEFNGLQGTFASPNYPSPYLHERKCEWRITVPMGQRVTLVINDLNIDLHQECHLHYVSFHNGHGENTPMINKLCGEIAPGTLLKSTGNKITVIMKTDGTNVGRGFKITYTSSEEAVCGGIFYSSNTGNIMSPGYDGITSYANQLNCEWIIQNPHSSNTTIYLSFENFHLEHHRSCQADYLEMRIGDSDGELINRWCGQTVPEKPLILAAPQIWLHFLSDNSNSDKGFFIHYMSSGCGGIQTAESGVLASPNYPNPYDSSSHCAWLLVAPEGQTIILIFTAFEIENHSDCRWDSVTIMNGGSPSSTVIGQYCGTTSPGTIHSGSNKLLVNFNSDHSVQGGCGGILHSENGTIKSPHWPQNFPVNTRCMWTIITHGSKHLEINFDSNFQIPDSNGQCQSSYVKVWRGRDEKEETLLSTGCGNVAPGPVDAPSNVVTIVFQSQDIPGHGFSASFISRCGANFTGPEGRIISPNYPSQYDNNLNCNYIIDVGPQSFVMLRFESFNLECNRTCAYDAVKIFRGTRVSSYPVATWCGSVLPGPFSTFGPMLLNLYTDSHIADLGFLAKYTVIPCGGVFNGSFGTVKSPAHSIIDYHNNMNCSYHITVGSNKVVALKLNDFHLEASSSCYKDYVAIYDGKDIYAPLLGKFCGSELPPTIKSSSNNLLLVFMTDFFEAARGWKASFRETIGPQHGCGGYLTNSSYSFGSPDSNSDGKYDKNLDCVWVIAAPVNKLINLTFTAFVLEAASSPTCQYDYIKLYDGDNENANLVGTFCGSAVPAPFVSTDNFLTVKFITDFSVEITGFSATYTTVDRLCGGTYNATSTPQIATSPNFPNAYSPFTVCLWVIDAPPEQQVRLTVQTLHLHPSQDCSQNYLEFQDSTAVRDERQVNRFCGTETYAIPEFYSHGRTAIVIFKSEDYVGNNGVSFTYQAAGCSREYNQSFGYLKSPGWPGRHTNNLDCAIVLRSPLNHTISLFFDVFTLEDTSQCIYDFLEIRNGSDASAPLLGKYCGHALPSPVFPKNHVVYLRFKSDALIAYDGYKITWTSSPSGCGGTLYGETGTFASPDYPATYQNQTNCEWKIIAPRGRIITVHFAFVNIDDPGDCVRNYLILYNGPDASYPSIGPYCGMDTNIASFTAVSNHVFIKFHAEYVTLPSGFRLTWTS
uniref:Cubilin n=1 Tax=Sphenodon punctatus TaxID=8508 RepID=A0A8D0GFF0_SPHPU